ncbi:MAG: hypothetical protein HGA27_00445 [Peptococcaceae bacterium]|nr:hypothetical protein [Peptococcaceae bacterium]
MDNKKWYKSKAVWGGLIVVASAGANLLGINIDQQAQSEAVNHIVDIVGALGGLLAIYGRIKANKTIG